MFSRSSCRIAASRNTAFAPGDRLIVTRDDVGFVDTIEILVMNDTTARISALQSGQVHMINRV